MDPDDKGTWRERWEYRKEMRAHGVAGFWGLRLARAPGAVRKLMAPPRPPRMVPLVHHNRVLDTPPGLQATRDQPGPYDRPDKRGQAAFRDHVQAHLVWSQMPLCARVIDEETQLPMDPAPRVLVVSERVLHGVAPFCSHGCLTKNACLVWLSLPWSVTVRAQHGSPGLPPRVAQPPVPPGAPTSGKAPAGGRGYTQGGARRADGL